MRSITSSQFSDDQSLSNSPLDTASETASTTESFDEPSYKTRDAFLGLAERLDATLGEMPAGTSQQNIDAINSIMDKIRDEPPTTAEDLMEQLEKLAKISPELRGKFEEILSEIAILDEFGEFKDTVSEISNLDKYTTADDAVAREHSKTKSLSDLVTSESGEILEPSLEDKVADELANMPNPAFESDAERIAREEEERKRKSAESGSTNTNSNYNHFSSSKDLDPNIAAAGLKLAGVLAIALGIGGPVGLILAGLFLIATKNIANGKTVTHINSGDENHNTAPEVGDNFLRNMMQSAQAQMAQNQAVSNAPTNMAASTGKTLEDMQSGLVPHQKTLRNLGVESQAVDDKKQDVDERTKTVIEAVTTPRSDGADISPRR